VSNENIFYHAEIKLLPPERPLDFETIVTATALEFKFSDGRTISYQRDPIDVGDLTFSYKKAGKCKYVYTYTFDNRHVQMIRVGEFEHSFYRTVMTAPDGWIGLFLGWSPSWEDPVTRCETARYSILSDHLPGPLRLHIGGAERVHDDFKLPFRGDDPWERHLMQQIQITISQYGTSVDPWVIGPAFKPSPTEKEIRERIYELVELHSLEFLRPLNDANAKLIEAEDAVVPGTDFELQVFDCLKVAIRAMIPDNSAAPQNQKARMGRKLRSRLAARGVTTPEQAKLRLRSLRAAQEILNILMWKASTAVMQQYGPCQADIDERDARLVALTKSKAFFDKWPMIAERLLVDEPYHAKLSSGINAARKRLSTRIETLHLAYDLKVSPEFCKAELARGCAANLAKIQAESVFGIHLSDAEAKASLSEENWQLIDKVSYGQDNRRRFNCQAGKHQLRADVWTDYVDEKIEGISLQVAFQVLVREQDGSEEIRSFESNPLITLQVDQGWALGETLLRFPTM
jgi:hypothetical protein